MFQPVPAAGFATDTIWSRVLSKLTLADAPLSGTLADVVMSTKKVLPVVVPTVDGERLIVPVPAASAVAGASTAATRKMAPTDRAVSLDRFTWLSLSGIGGRSRT